MICSKDLISKLPATHDQAEFLVEFAEINTSELTNGFSLILTRNYIQSYGRLVCFRGAGAAACSDARAPVHGVWGIITAGKGRFITFGDDWLRGHLACFYSQLLIQA